MASRAGVARQPHYLEDGNDISDQESIAGRTRRDSARVVRRRAGAGRYHGIHADRQLADRAPNWEAYTEDLKKNTLPVLEKLLADGVITQYGLVSATIHTPDGYTHSTWYSSRTIAGLEKALAAILAADKKLPAAERRRGDTDFAGTKHADLLVRSRILRAQTTKLTSGYITVGTDQIQPGKVQAYNERFEKFLRPIVEPLAASGAVRRTASTRSSSTPVTR